MLISVLQSVQEQVFWFLRNSMAFVLRADIPVFGERQESISGAKLGGMWI